MRRIMLMTSMISIGSACGGGQAPPAAVASPPSEAAERRPRPVLAATGEIPRRRLDEVLDAGFPRFLQRVETEPHLADGQFIGFRLTSLFSDDERFAGLDLSPGDTVVRVNGQSIERPAEALAVWNGLRVASELVVEYLRDGQPRELRFTIVD